MLPPPLFAWPDGIDTLATAAFFGLAFLLPLFGYVFLVTDFRAYLKTLNRMLIRLRDYLPHMPEWARYETPRALQVFGLKLPCTEEMLLQSYRVQVKKLHPDRGGDKQKFMLLQTHFEQAQQFLRNVAQQPVAASRSREHR